MGRDRKATLGKVNSTSNLDSSSTVSASSSHLSATHKIITPAEYKLPLASTEKKRKIISSSTWRPGQIYVRDFSTVHGSHYTDPATRQIDEREIEMEQAQVAFDNARQELRTTAMEKLGIMAKTKFGNVSNMLRAVNKNPFSPPFVFLFLPSQFLTIFMLPTFLKSFSSRKTREIQFL